MQSVCTLRGQPGACTAVSYRPSLSSLRPAQVAVGDDSGTAVLWNLGTRRPILSFSHRPPKEAGDDADDRSASTIPEAYRNPHILALGFVTADVLFTHGRDQRVRFWFVDESQMDLAPIHRKMKAVGPLADRQVPMCGFCNVALSPPLPPSPSSEAVQGDAIDDVRHVLFVPDESERRKVFGWTVRVRGSDVRVSAAGWDVPIDTREKLGMPMVLQTVAASASTTTTTALQLAAGFESGHVCVWQLSAALEASSNESDGSPSVTRFRVDRFTLIRAMADPITSLVLSASTRAPLNQQRVFLASVTGTLQAYAIVMPTTMPDEEEPSDAAAAGEQQQQQTLLWEDTMPAGGGHLALRSPADRIVALGAFDGTLRLYDAVCGSRIAVVNPAGLATESAVHAVAFDPAIPCRLLSASADRNVAVWALPAAILDAATAE